MRIVSLPDDLWTKVWDGVREELLVALLIAAIVVVLHFMFKKGAELFAWFMPVRVYGKWQTFMDKGTGERPPSLYEGKWEQTYDGITHRLTETLVGNNRDVHSTGETNEKRHEDAELHQFLNWVWGEAKWNSNPAISYIVRGHIVGQQLSLIYRERNGLDSGAILLDVKTKELMEGFEVGHDPGTAAIYSNPYRWRRQ
jgi:hypothetical protein